MNNEVSKILAVSGGAFAGGAAVKLMKKSDGTTNPVAAIGATGVGVGLAVKGKSPMMKAFGMGLAAIGIVSTIGLVAEKVPMLSKVSPSINGLGEIYYDEDGNLIDLDGLNGQPQLVQDESGQTYMVEGLDGDEDLDDYEDLVGLAGDDYDDYDDYDDLDGLGELEDLV